MESDQVWMPGTLWVHPGCEQCSNSVGGDIARAVAKRPRNCSVCGHPPHEYHLWRGDQKGEPAMKSEASGSAIVALTDRENLIRGALARPNITRCCNRCDFWDRMGDSDNGFCRFSPPEMKTPAWPRTGAGDWCGSFQQQRDAR